MFTHGDSAGFSGEITSSGLGDTAGAAVISAPRHAAVRPAFSARFSEEQAMTPYAEAVQRFGASDPCSLMVPGHGNAAAGGAEHLSELFGERLPALDVPLMLDGIDLGSDSALVQAQRLAAEAWGARRTWFLTNGASQANRTAAIALRGLGGRILVQRAMHSSLTDGILLAGLSPSFVAPSIDADHGIAHGLTPAALDAALTREAEAGRPVSSVYAVSPSYFGAVADVAGLVEVAHAHDAAIIIDNAWGPHFGFHPELPESPARLGADLVVSSTHKLAGSLTQSAMLHLGEGPFADRLEPLIERAFSMTSSTSLSAVLMASLDSARHAMVAGERQIDRAIRQCDELRNRLREHSDYAVISDEYAAFPDIVSGDPLHIPIDVRALGRSGHWVRGELSRRFGVYMELSTASCVVAVIGALRSLDVGRIMAALDEVAADAKRLGAEDIATFPALPTPGEMRVLPRDAYFGAVATVSAAEAVGRISADTLAAYPPGIPNLLPGEEITAETIEFLQTVAASPTGYVRGAVDSGVTLVRVMAE